MRAAHALSRRAARGAAVLSMRAGRAQLGNPCRPSHAFTRGPHNTLCLQRDDGLLQQPAGLPASSLSSAATAQQMQPPPRKSYACMALMHMCAWLRQPAPAAAAPLRVRTTASGIPGKQAGALKLALMGATTEPARAQNSTRPVARCAYYTG